MSGLSALGRVKHHHKESYEYIMRALEIDEDPDGVKQDAVELYTLGVEELKKGLQEKCIGASQEDKIKADRIMAKMKNNLTMANERIDSLMKYKDNPSSKSKPEKKPKSVNNFSSDSQKENSRPSSSNLKASSASGTSNRSRTPTRKPTEDRKPQTSRKPWNYSPAPKPQRSNERNKKISPESTPLRQRVKIKNISKEMIERVLDELIEPGSHSVRFADVAGQEVAKQNLREMVILPALRPEFFTGLRTPARGLLLFGPPGTGKTLLAKAVAAEAGSNFFNISASTLTSKWVGEGEKMVKALFMVAKEVQPSVIFIDEIDSLLSERKEGESDSTRRLKTEFMMRFDGVDSDKSDRILVMGATNRPQELDDAVLRRFPKRVYVGLPDVRAREELLSMLLAKQKSNFSKSDIKKLALQTDLYSGSDLTELAKDAALGPVREMSHDQLISIDVTQMRPIQYKDFEQSLKKIRPSASTKLLDVYEKWNAEYGDSSAL